MVIQTPCEIFVSWLSPRIYSPDNMAGPMRLEQLVQNLFGIIATSATYFILREREANRPTGVGSAIGAGFNYWGWMFATRFIVGAAFIFALIVPIVPAALLLAPHLGLVAFMVVAIPLMVPGFYLLLRLSFCEAAVVAEDRWGFDAARVSIDLTRGKIWRTFCWLLGGYLPCALLAIMVNLPFALLSNDNWMLDAVGGTLSDIVLIFDYPMIWAIYTRLCAEREQEASPKMFANLS